jgi:hypothetical protein
VAESNTPAELSLSQVTPEESPELIAAREALTTAEQSRDEAEAVLSKHRATLDAQAAKVNALRQSVQSGDLEAAEKAPAEAREYEAMQQQVADVQRVAMARRQAVRSAELRVTLAEAVAGIGHMADDDEQARFSAEVGQAVKLLILPALRQARESDRNTWAATERIKSHQREWQGWAAAERGRGKLDDWASLSLNGSEHSPTGFDYRGQRFHGSAEFRLEQAFKRAWSNAVAELIQERQQEREQAQQGAGQ